jgi:hypothetical protein
MDPPPFASPAVPRMDAIRVWTPALWDRVTMAEAIVWNALAAGFVLAAVMHFVRAARSNDRRSPARRGLGVASISWACAALLYPHDPRAWSYVAMAAGGVMMIVSALLSARDG